VSNKNERNGGLSEIKNIALLDRIMAT